MKKGLLLSIAASTVIFAGGDIAPVEPAAPASADFWGQIGVRFEANDNGSTYDLGDSENNKFSTAIVLGVEKQLGYGFGVGAEVAGWSDFGLNIADLSATNTALNTDPTSAEVSQAYLTYTFGNTAIKAGRQALPKAVSPWAWSDRSVGVLDLSYDAVVVANTDIENTTLVGAWVANAVDGDNDAQLGAGHNGIWMLAAVNKSLANTTLIGTAYYAPTYNVKLPGGTYAWGKAGDVWSLWGSAVTNFDGYTAGLQLAYVDGDLVKKDSTFGIAGKIGSTWGNLDATVYADYINDGEYSLNTANTGVGTSAFWGRALNGSMKGGDVASTTNGYSQWGTRVEAGYKLPVGKLFGQLAYIDYDGSAGKDFDDKYGALVGYKVKVMGVDTKVQYRYWTEEQVNGSSTDKQRVRVEAYYKF